MKSAYTRGIETDPHVENHGQNQQYNENQPNAAVLQYKSLEVTMHYYKALMLSIITVI